MRRASPHRFTPFSADLHPLDAGPFALVCKDAHGVQIAAANDAALRSGIHEGMRLADARALLPTLVTQPAQVKADAILLRKLADWCQRYTPLVGIDGVDGLWLDITGASHLCGGENALLVDLQERLTGIGFAHGLGLADTLGGAWAVARFAASKECRDRNIPSGGLASALETLPLEALRLDENALYFLERFGLKTIGALRHLPRASLKRRFPSKETCEAVLHRLDQALGRVAEPVVSLRSIPAYCERLSFAEPILATESFHFALHELLVRITQRMEQDRKGATKLTFSAYHGDGEVSRAAIATARPSRDVEHLAHLFRDRIEKINPGFGVDVLALSADAVGALGAEQLAFSDRSAEIHGNDTVDQLIDRLSNRLGTHQVQRIVVRESHIPECAEQRIPALHGLMHEAENPPSKPLRPTRLLTRPEPIQVMAEVPEGPPMRFTWRRVMHRVVRAEGPERIAPEWWQTNEEGLERRQRTRDYYRVEDDQGRRFWLFREGLYRDADKPLPTWHIHGLFA